MSTSSWTHIRPGDIVTVQNRFLAVSRSVTVRSLLPAPARGFIDVDGQTFTHDGHALAIGAAPTAEDSARELLRELAAAHRQPQAS